MLCPGLRQHGCFWIQTKHGVAIRIANSWISLERSWLFFAIPLALRRAFFTWECHPDGFSSLSLSRPVEYATGGEDGDRPIGQDLTGIYCNNFLPKESLEYATDIWYCFAAAYGLVYVLHIVYETASASFSSHVCEVRIAAEALTHGEFGEIAATVVRCILTNNVFGVVWCCFMDRRPTDNGREGRTRGRFIRVCSRFRRYFLCVVLSTKPPCYGRHGNSRRGCLRNLICSQ